MTNSEQQTQTIHLIVMEYSSTDQYGFTLKMCLFDGFCSKAGIDIYSVGVKDEKSEDEKDDTMVIIVTNNW